MPPPLEPDPYLPALLAEAPRVLGLMDREDASPTRGSLDRTHWAWKFTDFASPRFQEGLCALAFLHGLDDPANPWRGNPRLRGWIEAGLEAWLRAQHGDGSFDEAYPFERSLAATAFTSFYVSECLGFVGEALDGAVRERVVAALVRAGDWLVRNDEHHGVLSNHLAAAGAALLHIHALSGRARFADRGRAFLDRVRSRQSPEGWTEEYGGADPGYQTACAFYVARALELAPDPALEASLRASFVFLAHFVHPDGSLGGEYASRGTQTGYPAAFEMWADRDPAARWIASNLRRSLFDGHAVGLAGVDAYNAFPLLNQYVFAHRAAHGQASPVDGAPDPTPAEGVTHFPDAGLLRVRTARFDAYAGLSKGGVVRVFDRRLRRLVLADCGYVGTLPGGRLVASACFARPPRARVGDGEATVEAPLWAFRRPTFRPAGFGAFRLATGILGRLPAVSRWIKQRLVGVLIRDRRESGVVLSRRITWTADTLRIEDRLQGTPDRRLAGLRWTERFTAAHMGSARYFVMAELEGGPVSPEDRAPIDPRALPEGVTRVRELRLPGEP